MRAHGLVLAPLILAAIAHAQAPDCLITVNLTAAGNAPVSQTAGTSADNRFKGCTFWVLTFSSSGLTATFTLQSAPDNAGAPGAWVTYAGQSVTTGTNPATLTAGNSTLILLTGYNAWVRVHVSSVTGTGVATGTALGWRSNSP
jgi:hypothetical protein